MFSPTVGWWHDQRHHHRQGDTVGQVEPGWADGRLSEVYRRRASLPRLRSAHGHEVLQPRRNSRRTRNSRGHRWACSTSACTVCISFRTLLLITSRR